MLSPTLSTELRRRNRSVLATLKKEGQRHRLDLKEQSERRSASTKPRGRTVVALIDCELRVKRTCESITRPYEEASRSSPRSIDRLQGFCRCSTCDCRERFASEQAEQQEERKEQVRTGVLID
jgi:hypothetical protein